MPEAKFAGRVVSWATTHRAMIAFFKRRWILLSCALVLALCTTFGLTITGSFRLGLEKGYFFFLGPLAWPRGPWVLELNDQMPRGGGMPLWFRDSVTSHWCIGIPVWLPLSIVIGGIVIREFRRPESRAMLAFLKRRRCLLSCGMVLLACTLFDLGWYQDRSVGSTFTSTWGGLENGNYLVKWWCRDFGIDAEEKVESGLFASFHGPHFGRSPKCDIRVYLRDVVIPIWLPLSAVFAWIVIRELRWREKPAKAADCPRASAS